MDEQSQVNLLCSQGVLASCDGRIAFHLTTRRNPWDLAKRSELTLPSIGILCDVAYPFASWAPDKDFRRNLSGTFPFRSSKYLLDWGKRKEDPVL